MMRFSLCIVVCLGLATVINARAVRDWNRYSRGAYYLIGGRESIKLLMKGAKEVTPSPDKYTRLFLKSGDYETAVNDFQAAKLTSVRNFCCSNDGLMGHAGTRNVVLRKYDDGGLPTITITKFQPNYSGQNIDGRMVTFDKIVYDGVPK